MLDKENLKILCKTVANAKPSQTYSFNDEKFSYAQLTEALRQELNEYAKSYASFRENKNLIFELIETAIDDILPGRVLEQYGQFAEVKTFAQGDKPVFVQKITSASKRRAKQFITKVGLAGRYEVFKLDQKSFEVPTMAVGGAAQIGLEEFLDGRVDFADLLDIVMEGIDEAIYTEIAKALIGVADSIGENNKASETSFVEAEMDKLISVADSYGPSTIYCTYEFAATMVPSEGWISDDMRNQKWNNGYLANYKGHRVIVLNQSYTDETNATKVIDPAYAWIIPTGANEKPIKVALEGQTLVRETENEDWSKDIQVYKKFGVAAVVTNNICVYINSSLKVNDN